MGTLQHRAAIIDSLSLKCADTVGAQSNDYDAGKKINGRKRHILTDTHGNLPGVLVIPPACRTATRYAWCAASTAICC